MCGCQCACAGVCVTHEWLLTVMALAEGLGAVEGGSRMVPACGGPAAGAARAAHWAGTARQALGVKHPAWTRRRRRRLFVPRRRCCRAWTAAGWAAGRGRDGRSCEVAGERQRGGRAALRRESRAGWLSKHDLPPIASSPCGDGSSEEQRRRDCAAALAAYCSSTGAGPRPGMGLETLAH